MHTSVRRSCVRDHADVTVRVGLAELAIRAIEPIRDLAHGHASNARGTLATATGLVIFGEDGGALMAADAVTGAPLWSFPANVGWKASPMTYMFDGKQ